MTTMTAAQWKSHHEAQVREAQQALDDLDSLNWPHQHGEIDVARQRAELIAERSDHASEAAYWLGQITPQRPT